jgi:hypothetical protein
LRPRAYSGLAAHAGEGDYTRLIGEVLARSIARVGTRAGAEPVLDLPEAEPIVDITDLPV